MVANLKDYTPSQIDVIISDEVRDIFPDTIFEGEDLDKILDVFGKEFVACFPTKMEVVRKMDEYEIKETREEYCLITEDELPVKERELEETIEQAKLMKKHAEEELDAVRKRINELAFKVKLGTANYQLPAKGTVQFCLNGYRLTYSFLNGRMQLMSGEKLSAKDKSELWSQEDKNREIFNRLFDCDYPEVERPDDAAPQNLEEALNDAYELEDKNLPFEHFSND